MKSMRWALALCLLSAVAGACGPRAEEAPPSARRASGPAVLQKIPLSFPNGRIILVDVVDTPEGRERGLMFRKGLPKDYGMLFVFPETMGLSFWMKNTWVSLDIVYIGGDKRVARVHRRVKPSMEKTSDQDVARVSGTGRYVLELPAGTADRLGLAEGQELKFEAATAPK